METIKECVLTGILCWMIGAMLSGCAVDQREVYNMITKQKSEIEKPWINRIPAKVKGK